MHYIKIGLLFFYLALSAVCVPNHSNNFEIVIKSLAMVIQEHPHVNYFKVLDPYTFNCFPFFNEQYATQVIFNECFILTIAHGRVYGMNGNVLVENNYIKELLWAGQTHWLNNFVQVAENDVVKIAGNVLVLAQPVSDSYCHFMHEVLGRLALLEMQGIEYDYVYLPIFKPFIKEMLLLWGIDLNKVISPLKHESCVQAENLIIPSLVLNSNIGFVNAGFRPHPQTSAYVRNKLLEGALQQNIDLSKFSKKVFISRSDAPQRRIINEDEIFERFEPYGFVRYELSKLSVVEQILLMHNADIVIGEHGAGLTNILFCKPDTLVIELFQKLIDNSNWWIANIAQVNYVPVNCLQEDVSWAADWKSYYMKYCEAWAAKTVVPFDAIDKVIEKYMAKKS